MAVFVTGDVHSGFDLDKIVTWDERTPHSPQDALIIAGDFGYPWNFGERECEELRWLASRPYSIAFVDGNHERYDWWTKRPVERWHGGRVQRMGLCGDGVDGAADADGAGTIDGSNIIHLMRGEVFTLEGARIFCMGGAMSAGRDPEREGVSWWPDELPDERDFAHARERLDACSWQVDYVITHTCSTGLTPRALPPELSWIRPEPDRLTSFLDELEARLSFRRWYFGHLHDDKDVDERHTLLYRQVVRLGSPLGEARQGMSGEL